MKDLNHEPDFDPALEHELSKLAPAPVKERLLERMENAVTHNTASVKPAQHPARNWRLWVMPATAVAGIALMVLLAPQSPTPKPPNRLPLRIRCRPWRRPRKHPSSSFPFAATTK